MADTTPRKRASVITLYKHSELNQKNIAKALEMSRATVCRIIKQFNATGSVTLQRKGKCGRKRFTSPRDDALILRESKRNPRKTNDELMKDLAHAGVKISLNTVRKRLLESGRRAMRPFKKQLLTKKMKSKRLAWAKKHKTWTVEEWKKVLFSDESHFYVRGEHSKFVRRSIGESLNSHHVNQTVKHPQKKMFWGCFSYAGVGSLFPVEGMMNSDRYIDVIKKK